jgi:hypothetical protein
MYCIWIYRTNNCIFLQNGKTPLDVARHFGHAEIVAYLEGVLEAQRRVRFYDIRLNTFICENRI